MSAPLRRRTKLSLSVAAKDVLISGIDLFGDFTDANGRTRLQESWARFGKEILAEHIAADRTTRPAAWWWWSAPKNLRIAYPLRLFKTLQRELLIGHRLLRGAALTEAKKQLQAFRDSGQAMALWELER